MTKKIKVKAVRRVPIDADKMASALIQIAVRVAKKPTDATKQVSDNAHE